MEGIGYGPGYGAALGKSGKGKVKSTYQRLARLSCTFACCFHPFARTHMTIQCCIVLGNYICTAVMRDVKKKYT